MMSLSRISRPLLPLCLVAVAVLAWATQLNFAERENLQGPSGAKSTNASERIPDQQPINAPKISPEQAFRKGILSLKGEVNLWNTNGLIKFYRTDRGNWYMQVTKYPGVPLGGIWIRIKDDGAVERGYGF